MIFSEYQWLNPSSEECDRDELSMKCMKKIKEVCSDILNKGEDSRFCSLFDLLYEQIEAEILHEVQEGPDYDL